MSVEESVCVRVYVCVKRPGLGFSVGPKYVGAQSFNNRRYVYLYMCRGMYICVRYWEMYNHVANTAVDFAPAAALS